MLFEQIQILFDSQLYEDVKTVVILIMPNLK